MTLLSQRLHVSSNTINGMILGSITPYNKNEVKLVSVLHLIPSFTFYSFSSVCLLSDTYRWFYSFIVPQWVLAMSRYFSPHISEFIVDFFIFFMEMRVSF